MTCPCCDHAAPPVSHGPSRVARRTILAGGLAAGVTPFLPGLRTFAGADGSPAGVTRDFGFLPPRPKTEQHVRPIMFPVLPDPVLGKATWTDTYLAPRGGGRQHEGQDLMGKKMLKLLAVTDGEIVELRHASTGNSLYLKGDDGWYYCYLHINNDTPGTDDGKNVFEQAFAAGLAKGDKVKKGQLLAYLGDSGNAEASGSHCHFEIRMPNARWYNAAAVNAHYSLIAAEPAKLGGGDTTTAPPADGFAPFSSPDSFAARQAKDFLNVTATSTWVKTAVTRLQAGTSADSFIASLLDEAPQTTVVAPTIRLYQAYFLRRPDTAGVTFWISQVRKGVGLDKVSDKFASSSEFTNRYGKLGNAEFVRRVYLNLFGREPDNSGYLHWTLQLDQGKSRGWVMRQLCESAEYRGKTQEMVDVVSVNLAMLGTAPSDTELSNWTKMTKAASGALVMMINQIRTSAAYAARVGA